MNIKPPTLTHTFITCCLVKDTTSNCHRQEALLQEP
jgi:hypothetical protein